MTAIDLTFALAAVRTYHLSFGSSASYWQDYGTTRADGGGGTVDGSPRYEFKEGWQTVYATAVETPLVRVELSDGTVGWGESNTPIAPEIVCMMLDRAIAPMVVRRSFAGPQQLWDFAYDTQRGRGVNSGYWMDALAALDIAVWDALGKRNGVPVARLICDAPRREIPVYQSGLRQATLEARADFANESAERGVRGVKIFPTGNVDDVLGELDSLMARCLGVEQWMVDALWMCDFDSAVVLKRELGERGVRFFECPLQPELLAQHRELVAMDGAPIALGEHFRTEYQLRDWLTAPLALDVFQPDIGRTGISDYLRQLELANAAGIPTTPHMGNGVSIFQAATLHCATVASPSMLQEFQSGLSTLLRDATETAWQLERGMFILQDVVGLGVSVDEAALADYVVPKGW